MSAGDAGTCTRAPPEGAGSSQTRIVDLSGDLLAYIYSTYLAELVVPHLAVCQRFRSVLLGVECVEFRVEVVRARGLPLAASALQRFRGDVRLVLYTSDDDDALVAARCWHDHIGRPQPQPSKLDQTRLRILDTRAHRSLPTSSGLDKRQFASQTRQRHTRKRRPSCAFNL